MKIPDRVAQPLWSLLFVRHGLTDWNESAQLQGHRDIALNARGRAEMARRALPAEWCGARWYSSPLQRALGSACLLGGVAVQSHELLKEMHWGDWEGRSLASLREELGPQLRENEARGLDFRPAGGESPREVRERVRRWLASLPARGERAVVVTHKGVIRAALSLATDWPMRDAFTSRVDWSCGHEFSYDARSGLRLTRLNVHLPERCG